ncbi:MAG: hypothetical protein HN392_05175 [Anaerolineae bacterium]|jgi:hypothetical protein|nr:hypothetical protein [Anaerolineae bacterium]MBT7782162.1 hypothetical protein [Anaerolineae bacterium]
MCKENLKLNIIRWANSKAPTEESIAQILRAENLSYYPCSNSPNDLYAPHFHA